MADERDHLQWFPPSLPGAACRGYPVEWWVPPRGTVHAEARAICARCPERDPCLVFALRTPGAEGIWGGMSPKDRKQIRKRVKEVLMTMTDSPERARRVADLWTANPNMTEADVAAQVDAELRAEAERRAIDEAKSKEMTDSLDRFMRCVVCGEKRGLGVRDGFCDKCRSVVAQVVADRNVVELVRGRTRRELAESYLERTGR